MEGETEAASYRSSVPPSPPAEVLRWPWMLVAASIGMTAFGLLVSTLPQLIQIGADDGAIYTNWVAKPLAGGYVVGFLAALPTCAVLSFRRWAVRTRVVMVASLAVVAVMCGLRGIEDSQARGEIGPTLVTAVASVHIPSGLMSLGPTQLTNTDADVAPNSYLPTEPEAERVFQPLVATAAAECAQLEVIARSQSGWTSRGCAPEYAAALGKYLPGGAFGASIRRVHGRVVTTVGFNRPSVAGGELIRIDAYPNDGDQ